VSRKDANISAILLLIQMFIGLPFVEVNAWLKPGVHSVQREVY
jgi:hypothetical protein